MSRVHRGQRLEKDAQAKMEAMKAISPEDRARYGLGDGRRGGGGGQEEEEDVDVGKCSACSCSCVAHVPFRGITGTPWRQLRAFAH